ncbi:MAG TPA: hypothetical protein VFO94_01010, partial [Gammaproteobacteria bacterium]|nr:hypothetical protein [Gammaproteobacteria bacterium]
MKKILGAAAVVALLVICLSIPRFHSSHAPHSAARALPVHFEPSGDAAGFAARGAGFALELGDGGARLQFSRGASSAALALQLEGAQLGAARPENLLPGVSNYFLGEDPRNWRRGVPHYARVRYENVYPGVDLVYYGAEGQLEYDFLLAPGADAGLIRMRYDGARTVRLDAAGNLHVIVEGGELVHRRPVSWQWMDGARRSVDSAFRILRDAGRAVVSFELGDYDPTLPLTIDPVLSYATYLGGTDDNENLTAIVVDAAGAAYVAGNTTSIDFPTTPGAVQPARSNGFDAFVAKLDPAGTAFEYVTYLGGSSTEEALGLRVDAAGNAYLAGSTFSADFPVTVGAAQTTAGGVSDVFVAKLDAAGGALLYSTYLGGSGGEPANASLGGFEIDASGDAFVYGTTDSTDFPVSANAPQPTRGIPNPGPFDQDAFLTRISAAGDAFTFSTYLGGTAIEEHDDDGLSGRLMAIDGAGSVWVAGTTESDDFPVTAGAFDTSYNGPANSDPGGGDVFVAHYDTNAGTLLYATYVGGAGDEYAVALQADAGGNTYLAAQTQSGDFPVTAGAPDSSYGGGGSDVALFKLDASGSALTYATYLGGGLNETPRQIRLNPNGALTVAGETRSPDFP